MTVVGGVVVTRINWEVRKGGAQCNTIFCIVQYQQYELWMTYEKGGMRALSQ